MIPTAFDYVRAGSLDEALAAVAEGEGTKVIAGGHSLLPVMRFRLAQPSKLVDISELRELKGIADQGGGVRIGAAATYRELLDSELVRERYPVLVEATETIGDRQVRNRGTVGGSLAHADPASDMPALMLVLDASFTCRSRQGQRSVKAREFFLGAFSTALAEDELLTEIVIPPPPAGAGGAYVTFTQAASGYAIVAAAALVARSRGKVSHAEVALTGLGEVALRVEAARELVGTAGDAAAIERVAAAALPGDVDVSGDIHAPAEYRRSLVPVAVRRALEKALQRAK